jgi:hypothetical protein
MHYSLAAVIVFLASLSAAFDASAEALASPEDESAVAMLAAGKDAKPTREMLCGKAFRFSWKTERGSSHIGTATLREDGTIAGIRSPNETFWLVDGEGRLIFKHRDGRVSTIFTRAERRGGKWFFSGPFRFREGVQHLLEETPAPSNGDRIDRLIRAYSRQQIVRLDPGEACRFVSGHGLTKTIRLVSVEEHRDRVIDLMRRADVRIEIDGHLLELVCAPYVMPTEVAGLRVQADTTSGWIGMTKRVQLSLWDARDPIVDTTRFGFPLRHYRLFSQGTQAYNEPVHLGRGDGDPAGQKFYHNYGFDLAGYENGEEIVSVAEGKVVSFRPNRETCHGVTVQDLQGLPWEYGHMASLASDIAVGTRITRGQRIGTLGKTGGSGNFSHLHLGREGNCYVNLYPWLVTAYQAEHPKAVLAVARPHHAVRTGEKAILDGSHSLAFGGRIVQWRWVFHDGQTVDQAKAEKVFDTPGAYVATLWVKDDRGAADVDFCQIKVFSKPAAETAMPHIFMTYTPTEDVRPDQPLRFRFWLQGSDAGPIRVDFDDGTQVLDYRSYAELPHSFRTPGIHIVTAQCQAAGKLIMQKLKVAVH